MNTAEATFAGYTTGYAYKEANLAMLRPFAKTIMSLANRGAAVAKEAPGVAVGAGIGAASTVPEMKYIESVTDSDLRPGSKMMLMTGNTIKGALLGSKGFRHRMTRPNIVRDSFGRTIESQKTLAPLMSAGAAFTVPEASTYAWHKAFPYDKNKTVTNWAEVIEDPAGTMAKKIPKAISEYVAQDPKLSRTVHALKNEPDPYGRITETVVDKVLAASAKAAPGFTKAVGTSAGLGAAGGGIGWLAGKSLGNVLYRDTPQIPYKQRRARERKRTALKVLLSTVGSAGLIAAAGEHSGDLGQAFSNIKSKFQSKE